MSPAQKVERAAKRAAAAQAALVAAMREARESGMALRDVASAAGMSHEQVRRLTSKLPACLLPHG